MHTNTSTYIRNFILWHHRRKSLQVNVCKNMQKYEDSHVHSHIMAPKSMVRTARMLMQIHGHTYGFIYYGFINDDCTKSMQKYRHTSLLDFTCRDCVISESIFWCKCVFPRRSQACQQWRELLVRAFTGQNVNGPCTFWPLNCACVCMCRYFWMGTYTWSYAFVCMYMLICILCKGTLISWHITAVVHQHDLINFIVLAPSVLACICQALLGMNLVFG